MDIKTKHFVLDMDNNVWFPSSGDECPPRDQRSDFNWKFEVCDDGIAGRQNARVLKENPYGL